MLSSTIRCWQTVKQIACCRFLAEELNVEPRVAWMLDDFGHSRGEPLLRTQGGFEALIFTRSDKQVPAASCDGAWIVQSTCATVGCVAGSMAIDALQLDLHPFKALTTNIDVEPLKVLAFLLHCCERLRELACHTFGHIFVAALLWCRSCRNALLLSRQSWYGGDRLLLALSQTCGCQ